MGVPPSLVHKMRIEKCPRAVKKMGGKTGMMRMLWKYANQKSQPKQHAEVEKMLDLQSENPEKKFTKVCTH